MLGYLQYFPCTIFFNLPTSSITNTKLVTMVPPVAAADKNLIMRNSQNHGENPAAVPVTTWIITAHTSGPRLPNLKINVYLSKL